MSEENTNLKEENKDDSQANYSLWGKFWRMCLRSPINTIAVIFLLYYGFLAYVLEKDAFVNKTIMLGIVFLWGVWFFAKNMIKILLIVAVIGCGAYGYYRYTHLEQAQCEESGGEWNKVNKTCEKKLTFWQKLQNQWYEYKKAAELKEKAQTLTK